MNPRRIEAHISARLAWATALLAATAHDRPVEDAAATLADLADREDEAIALERIHPELPAHLLAQRLALSEAEVRLVWIAFALHEVGEVLTPDILARVATRKTRVSFAPTASLRRFAVLERCDGSSEGLHISRWSWTLAPRVIAFLEGNDAIDPQLSPLLLAKAEPVAIGELTHGAGFVAQLEIALARPEVVLVIAGPRGSGRRSALLALAANHGIRPLPIAVGQLAGTPDRLLEQLAAIARECRLLELTPLLVDFDELDATFERLVERSLVAQLDRRVLVTTSLERQPRWERSCVSITVEPPTSAQRKLLWRTALGQGSEDDASYLATQFPLAPSLIKRTAALALARAGNRPLEEEDFYAAIRSVLDESLGKLAHRVKTTQTWDDVVLVRDQRVAVDELVARIRQRSRVLEDWGFAAKINKGLGVCALFSGPPGTGKTMVAGLVARELRLELYQVDLSRIVSKFIGETEKQLGAIFDAAEAGRAILLFDEADALFGKRTDVKSSNDRYANLETNYLLQRLETFTGVCLMTTNHEANLDPAFQRRLALHLRFGLPDESERCAMWHALLPPEAPAESSIDFAELARRFVLSGGYIRNAVLRAAYLAADENRPISQRHLELAARRESESIGRLVI